MAAVFGAPVASLVLAVELLLFELRPRSLIPVALAAVTAVGVRYATYGLAPVFPMPEVLQPSGGALISLVRSEEHTSELQSLMRISYAFFCLSTRKQA